MEVGPPTDLISIIIIYLHGWLVCSLHLFHAFDTNSSNIGGAYPVISSRVQIIPMEFSVPRIRYQRPGKFNHGGRWGAFKWGRRMGTWNRIESIELECDLKSSRQLNWNGDSNDRGIIKFQMQINLANAVMQALSNQKTFRMPGGSRRGLSEHARYSGRRLALRAELAVHHQYAQNQRAHLPPTASVAKSRHCN